MTLFTACNKLYTGIADPRLYPPPPKKKKLNPPNNLNPPNYLYLLGGCVQ